MVPLLYSSSLPLLAFYLSGNGRANAVLRASYLFFLSIAARESFSVFLFALLLIFALFLLSTSFPLPFSLPAFCLSGNGRANALLSASYLFFSSMIVVRLTGSTMRPTY